MSSIASQLRTFIFPTPLSVFGKLCSSLPVHLDHLFSSNTNLCSTFYTFDPETYYTSLLEKSVSKNHLNQIHAKLYTNGLENNGFIIAKFIHVCSNLKEISYAHQVFDKFPDPYVFLWNAIIRGYSMHNMFANAIEMYTRMQHAYVSPDSFTFPHVLKACGGLVAIGIGTAVHAQSFRLGFENDVFVQNGLVAFYVKCNKICYAGNVFDGLQDRSVVSWTSIISGHAQNGQPMEALRIFSKMRASNVKPDWINLVSVLRAYSDVEDLEQGRSIHGLVIKVGLEFEPDLRIALTAMYVKCGQVIVAKSLFDQMKIPNVILWNAMLSGFAKNGYADEALELFSEMISKSIQPDAVSVQSAVLASAQLGSLDRARWMHDFVNNSEYKGDIFVSTALIDMYAKCGFLEKAYQVFEDMKCSRNLVTWNTMIMAFAIHGDGVKALELFNFMARAGVEPEPDSVSYLAALCACNHAGMVDEGVSLFELMEERGVSKNVKHYGTVVDLLGRAGRLEAAYEIIESMPMFPDAVLWQTLLGASKIYGNVEMAEKASRKLVEMGSSHCGDFVLLSNVYAAHKRWNDVGRVREAMKNRDVKKLPGFSYIELNGTIFKFYNGDQSHPDWKEIYTKLEEIRYRIREFGYVPETNYVLHDIGHEEKENALCYHSEKLAVAFGLISTDDGSLISVNKNLRICGDCHVVIKLISKLYDREIIVRDRTRFHRFRDGFCSCKDYW